MAQCVAILKVCQGEGERQDYAFDLTRAFSILWQRDYPYESGDVVRPNGNPGTGFQYSSSGGVSNGEAEPTWPTTDSESVPDGSLFWTAQVLSNDSLRHQIASVDWTAPPGITISDATTTDTPGLQEARIWVSGGIAGQTYTIVALITSTFNSAIFECRLQVKIV